MSQGGLAELFDEYVEDMYKKYPRGVPFEAQQILNWMEDFAEWLRSDRADADESHPITKESK